MLPKFNSRQYISIATPDKTWFYYSISARTIRNNLKHTEHSRRYVVAKRTIYTMKILIAYILFMRWFGRTNSDAKRQKWFTKKVLLKSL